jgi:hypothetical protein
MNQDSFADSTPSDAGVGEQLHGAESAPSASHSTITLELGDFLHRIPPGAIKGGPHDVHHALVFERADLEERLKDRDPTIPLSELYLRVPDIFRSSESAKSEVPVRMPYLKVTKMLAHKKVSGPSSSLTPAAAQAKQIAQAEAQISTHSTEATAEVEPPHTSAPLGGEAVSIPATRPNEAHAEVVEVAPHEANPEHDSGEVAPGAPSAPSADSFLETESASVLSENYSDFSPAAEPSLEHTQKDSEIASMEGSVGVSEADVVHGAPPDSESEAALRRQLAALERQRAEDAAELMRYISDIRKQMEPLYEKLTKIVAHRAWTREFYEAAKNEYSEIYGNVSYEAAFYDWFNGMSFVWPDLNEEKASDAVKIDETKLKGMTEILRTLLPIADPENRARMFQWAQDNLNEMGTMFSQDMSLDIETMTTYVPPDEAESKMPSAR